MSEMGNIKVGDLVKFKAPLSKDFLENQENFGHCQRHNYIFH